MKLLLLILAVYRLSEVLSIDTIMEPVRNFLGKRADKKGSLWWWLAEWINCPYCTGIWFSFGASFLMEPENVTSFIIYWLAIAGGQAFLESLTPTE